MYNDIELRPPESSEYGYNMISFCLSRINNIFHYDYIPMFTDNLTFSLNEIVRIISLFILMCHCNKLVLN